MSEAKQAILDAITDAQSWSEFINGAVGQFVDTRLGARYPTLEEAIKQLFTSGGINASPFKTKALMESSELIEGSYAIVTNDPVESNNGLYLKSDGVWDKSTSDPYRLAVMEAERRADQGSNVVPQMWFFDPYYERTSNALYVKPNSYLGDAFFMRDFRYGNVTVSLNDFYTQMAEGGKNKVVSPSGVPDCIKLDNIDSINYDTVNKRLVVSNRRASRDEIVVVATDLGYLAKCVEEDRISNQTSKPIREDYQALFYTENGHIIDNMPYVEQSNDISFKLYIKFNSARIISAKEADSPKAARTYINITNSWQVFVDSIGNNDLFEASPSGVENCLVLKDSVLVYDLMLSKYRVIQGTIYNENTQILIAAATYGQLVAGCLYDWWQAKRVSKIERDLKDVEGIVGTGGGYANPQSGALRGTNVKFVAHGGFNGNHRIAPYNTAPAYIAAGEYGYWGAETDIVETKDGEWVHCHDLFLEDYTNGIGNVKDYTLAELKLLDASKKSQPYGWSNIPMLEFSEYLDICVNYGMTPIIEFKSVPTNEGIIKVIGMIRDRMQLRDCILSSFDRDVLTRIRNISKEVRLSLLDFALTSGAITKALELGNCDISAMFSSSESMLREAREQGLAVSLWTLGQNGYDNNTHKLYDWIVTNDAVPHDFDKGQLLHIFRSDLDFSNVEDISNATVEDGYLVLPSGDLHIDIPNVQFGDVITVSYIGGAIDTDTAKQATSVIGQYDEGGVYTSANSTLTLNDDESLVRTQSCCILDNRAKTAKLAFLAHSSGLKFRNIIIKHYRV